MDDALPGSSIARRLASCDKHVRDKALRSLGKWLASHPDVRDEELCWIWKGLFYCIWHADKQHIQVELINRVASFVVSLDNFIAIRYFEVFLSTMRREWSGIDFLRILLDQKKKGNSNTQDEIANLGSIALKMGFAKKFFDLASSPDTVQGNRKFLFSLHEDYLKLEKDFEKLGIEVTELAGEVVADSNISSNQVEPYLENGSTLVYKASKKNKKNKKAPKDAVKDFGSDEKLGNGFIKSSEQVEQTLESCIDLAEGPSKKRKKVERASNGTSGKSKSKKNGLSGSATGKEPVLKNESEKVNNGDESYDSLTDSGHPITLDECVISNLQKQFEKAAADAGMDVILCPMPSGPVNGATSKKRKKAKNVVGMDEKQASVQQSDDEVEPEKGLEKSGDKSSKKVKFSMKNNLVWKPHNPLPPQSLRLPPSATPRGSALKKGIPPGPINETLAVKRKVKKKVCSVKKGMKTRKSVSASIKRLRKLQTLSV
ncbi:uncharacterized protein [Aristolochia californica]|uniref:uncharacterized protein isoform X2 n=1 Tax=Aristolochia californica TaxID=171875 RepID=UPI0035D52C3D